MYHRVQTTTDPQTEQSHERQVPEMAWSLAKLQKQGTNLSAVARDERIVLYPIVRSWMAFDAGTRSL